MSRRQLPPLHTLETFEVAAQQRSFKRAAEILHLTPSAVSHQIRALEDYLGVELFRRMNRAIELTSGGRAYLEIASQALARLRDGGQRVARQYGRNALKISMGPFIASEIVVPALPSFQREYPDVDIRIETSLQLVDLQHEDVDLVVRFGLPPWKGAQSELLTPVQAIPVCGAGLLQRYPDASPSNLKDIVLIHATPAPDAWNLWARNVGVELGETRQDMWFDSYLTQLRAAEQGVGVALGLLPLISPWLRSGRIVAAWPYPVDIPQGYYLLYRPGDERRKEIRAFRDWLHRLLRAQAQQSVESISSEDLQ